MARMRKGKGQLCRVVCFSGDTEDFGCERTGRAAVMVAVWTSIRRVEMERCSDVGVPITLVRATSEVYPWK